ncbi:hypothetical protein [Oleisolibacter albus]|uniref:hypothetical protein n=1 Tax=Oleisolibacter albus TaxID=2171757 RepID=UPI0012D77CAF|nr:hypothetical protein [Oleisolibacter albus]
MRRHSANAETKFPANTQEKRVLLFLPCVTFILSAAASLDVKAEETQKSSGEIPEIFVFGKKSVVPDFQEIMDFHNNEFQTLRKKFERSSKPVTRSELLMKTPNPDAGKSAIPSPSSAVTYGKPTDF